MAKTSTSGTKRLLQKVRSKKRYPLATLGNRLRERLGVYAGWFVIAIFTVHPLMIRLDTGYTNITETKGATFITILLCAVFLMVCATSYTLMLGHTPSIKLKERFRSLQPFDIALLGYWVVMLISACTSDDLHTAFMGASLRNEGFWFQTAYIGACLIVSRWYRPKVRDFVIMTCTAVLICIYVMFQYYGNDFLHFYPGGLPYGTKIIYFGTMSNVNVASTYFCTVFLIGSVLFVQHEDRRIRWFMLPCMWLIFYILLLGDTESGYVGLIAAFAVGFPFVAKDRKCFARTMLLLAGCALLAWLNMQAFRAYHGQEPQMTVLEPYLPILAGVLAAVAALAWFLPLKKELPKMVWRLGWLGLMVVVAVTGIVMLPTIAEKTGNTTLKQVESILQGEVDDDFGSGRFIAWSRALEMVKKHPILGYGPDNFGRVYIEEYTMPEYIRLQEEAVDRGEDPAGVEAPSTFDKAHNEYIQMLVDVGILGLAAMLAFYALLLYAGFRYGLDKPMVVALIAALGCFIVQAFFNFSTPFAHPVTWTCWGVLGALLRDLRDERAAAKQNGSGKEAVKAA